MIELNKNQLVYIWEVFILSVVIFLVVANILGGVQDTTVSYLLSLIASNFIVKEVKDIKWLLVYVNIAILI